ncbi:SDR family NAD(P)-dependent oxidoreductase [Sandaracinobacter neustonicus]|uniref:SDR family NAD(P)-dependent oxidoreductase n=1 Tax=Sandaracinobacter neustonicus TaxID=1715348 RepID=A0A501XIR2_9SPHN|nr:SDR family NAD(P)-dependent oxidoreductase [Sandaracinobacter neustonicus]TPE60541.1 SDR family NAD(P)-dependent oxidoreductase [Sandaracinobacter neustonicus]
MLLILGQGYSGTFIARAAHAAGQQVLGVRRQGGEGLIAFDDPALPDAIASASHILSSIPPDSSGADPVLTRFHGLLAHHGGWLAYLSSTGVYGDAGGAWVDEATPIGSGRREARTEADLGWQALGATIFRLPGIYGPGRSALDQVRAGTARRIDRPGHRFSRIHVADIAGAVLAAMQQRAQGIFNITDDLPAEPRHVTEFACRLLGAPLPPLLPLDDATLPPMARAFWTERRCVSGRKLARETGYRLRHPDYKAGLLAILKGIE